MIDDWKSRWEKTLAACEKVGGTARDLKIQNRASAMEITSIETKLGFQLPAAFREVLTDFSASVEFGWFLPSTKMPDKFQGIFSGECFWDLKMLIELEASRQSWIESCFPNPDDRYDAVWHNKLAFMPVPNGDLLALDLKIDDAPVIYLSHDDGEGHGYRLGRNFIDFIERWTLLGCVGAEDWQMLPFVSSSNSGLEPHGINAQKWREWFGLAF